MKLMLDASKTVFFVTSVAKVDISKAYEDGNRTDNQAIDPVTGFPIWTIVAEFIQGDIVESGVRIKVISKTEPELSPRTDYVTDGEIFATPYLPTGGKYPVTNITVVGNLKKMNQALPAKS